MTVGVNLIDYLGDKSTRTANITTSKLVENDIISTDNSKAACMGVTNFYLSTPMQDPSKYEYLRVPINLVPYKIIAEYNK